VKEDARKILIIGCGWAVVYGILNCISNKILLPSAPFISLRPQISIPMVIGILFHPLAGFMAGFAGNVIGDGLSGFGLWKFWNWHLANGLMGFIPGLICYAGIVRISTVRDFGILEMIIVFASAAAVAFAVLLDVLFLHFMTFPSSFTSWILPAFLTDAVNGFVLVPGILILARRLTMTLEIRTILLVTTLLLLAVLSTAGAITWSIMDDLISREALIKNFYIAGVVSVILIVIGFLASVAFVRKFTDPIMHLTRAAGEIENERYDIPTLESVSARRDELGQLSRVFQEMARKVGERERHLQQQVHQLQIKIDRERQTKDVREIVETDYFRELKKKAKEFRES
jgi:uncharacterized membrane protein